MRNFSFNDLADKGKEWKEFENVCTVNQKFKADTVNIAGGSTWVRVIRNANVNLSAIIQNENFNAKTVDYIEVQRGPI